MIHTITDNQDINLVPANSDITIMQFAVANLRTIAPKSVITIKGSTFVDMKTIKNGCVINISDNACVTIGDVEEDVQFNIVGNTNVTFKKRPPESVVDYIHSHKQGWGIVNIPEGYSNKKHKTSDYSSENYSQPAQFHSQPMDISNLNQSNVPQNIAVKMEEQRPNVSQAAATPAVQSQALTICSLAEALGVIAKNDSLITRLKVTNLDDAGATQLVAALEKNTFITHLDLSNNQLTLAGIKLFINLSENYNILNSLDISNNKLGNNDQFSLGDRIIGVNKTFIYFEVGKPFSLGIARKIKWQCQENKIKLENNVAPQSAAKSTSNHFSNQHSQASSVAHSAQPAPSIQPAYVAPQAAPQPAPQPVHVAPQPVHVAPQPAPIVSQPLFSSQPGSSYQQPTQQQTSNGASSSGQAHWRFDSATDQTAIAAVNNKEEIFSLIPAAPADIKKLMGYYNVEKREVASVQLIYSKVFEDSFSNAMWKLSKRARNPAFDPRWNQQADAALRGEVMKHFNEVSLPSEYDAVRLIPAWHGTKPSVLNSILAEGAANLASTDSGYFGKGLYGALEAEYAERVYSKGALLFLWMGVYSVYPVVGNKDNPGEWYEQLYGKSNYQNYDAHFVPVTPQIKNGVKSTTSYVPCVNLKDRVYTEVVGFNESLFFPRFLVQTRAVMIQGAPANNVEQAYCNGQAALKNGDYKTAVENYNLAAQQGFAPAQYMMGLMYFHGVVVEKSHENAKIWLTHSANHNHAPAHYDLGHLEDFDSRKHTHIEEASKHYSAIQEKHSAAASRLQKLANRYEDFFIKDAKGLLFFNPKKSGQQPVRGNFGFTPGLKK